MPHPTMCIYHKDCTDGFAAALAVWLKYGDSVTYHAANYHDLPPDVVGQHVLIIDFSYKRIVMEVLARLAASITVLDHHKSAEAELAPLLADGVVAGEFDMKRSGAMMTWEYLHPPGGINPKLPPTLFLQIQDYDLWRFNMPGTREIHAWLASQPYDFALWAGFLWPFQTDGNFVKDAKREGSAIRRMQQRHIDQSLPEMTRWMTIGGHLVPVVNLPRFMFEAAHQLAKLHEKPFAACYHDKTGVRHFDLRAPDSSGVDLSQIAARYGGGGHAKAAGFTMAVGWDGDDA